jgi:hypothetical protein
MMANKAKPAKAPQRISSNFFNFEPIKKTVFAAGQIPLVLFTSLES